MLPPASGRPGLSAALDALSQQDWERSARDLLDSGEAFLAYDQAREGLARFPDSLKLKQCAALGLLRTGALDEARRILEPLCSASRLSDDDLRRTYQNLRQTLAALQAGDAADPDISTLRMMGTLLTEIQSVVGNLSIDSALDEETLGILARIYKDGWKRTGAEGEGRRCRDMYLRAFQETGGYYTGINAATMSWLIGERDLARDLAQRTLEACDAARQRTRENDLYWIQATLGEAHLLLEDDHAAVDDYREAARLAGQRYAHVVSSLQQLRLMEQHGFPVPEAIFAVLLPPRVVVCSGHMIDAPGRKEPRFPAYLEAAVRREIDRRLEEMDARIGYCSAACGADLLFAEAMQDRDAEVNLVLPFEIGDFVKTSVEFAGPRWVSRFHKAMKLAHSVRYVTEERYLDDDVLFAFANQIFSAYAQLRARTLETAPFLLAVWDGKPSSLVGGTADAVSRWSDPERLQVVRLDILLASVSPPPVLVTSAPAQLIPAATSPTQPAPASPNPSNAPTPINKQTNKHPHVPTLSHTNTQTHTQNFRRDIKTMLFADVVGYSKLPEEYLPYYMYEFLQRVAEHLRGVDAAPSFTNTWGDAIFAVMDHAIPMAQYALALHDAVCETNWTDLGLPAQMNVRIALHAGPVFGGIDPIMGRTNFYGSHVNRAARLEPVTIPGCVYATEQFAALLTREATEAEQEARRNGRRFDFPFEIEYVGLLSLAKNFGSQTIYHVRRRIHSR